MTDRVDVTEIQFLQWDNPADQDRAHAWLVQFGREDIYLRLRNTVREVGAFKALMGVYQKWELDAEINLWSCLAARAEREILAEAAQVKTAIAAAAPHN